MGDHSMANDSTIDALKNGRDVSMVAPVVMPDIRHGSVFEQDDRAHGNDFGQARSKIQLKANADPIRDIDIGMGPVNKNVEDMNGEEK